jgi:hypothetical protein
VSINTATSLEDWTSGSYPADTRSRRRSSEHSTGFQTKTCSCMECRTGSCGVTLAASHCLGWTLKPVPSSPNFLLRALGLALMLCYREPTPLQLITACMCPNALFTHLQPISLSPGHNRSSQVHRVTSCKTREAHGTCASSSKSRRCCCVVLAWLHTPAAAAGHRTGPPAYNGVRLPGVADTVLACCFSVTTYPCHPQQLPAAAVLAAVLGAPRGCCNCCQTKAYCLTPAARQLLMLLLVQPAPHWRRPPPLH